MMKACVLVAALAVGCGKTAGRHVDERPDTPDAVTAGTGGTGTTPVKPVEVPDPACTPSTSPAPISQLSTFEVNRSVHALLDDNLASANLRWLTEDGSVDAFFLGYSPNDFDEQLHALAHDVALQLSQSAPALQKLSHCDPLTSGEATCAAAFTEAFLTRAYRRPATPEDTDEMLAVFAEGKRLGGDFGSGVRAVIEVALQSPEFSYLLELGSGEVSDAVVALTGYESAARLAYFLTGAPPDDELAALAAKGALDEAALESQARRLLGTPANRELVRHHYASLFGLSALGGEPALGFTAELAEFSLEESARFVEDVTFDGTGTFRALLTESSTWLNQPLAELYGVPGVTGPQFRKVALDPTQRGGLFTQAAFLRTGSHAASTSPVHRGLSVLRKLLCYDPPDPPPGIVVVPPPDPSLYPTMRERLTSATQGPVCQGCHHDINPIGFAFEHYDAVGRWRDTENGQTIDSSGELYRTDAQGRFGDALELMQRIADSNDGQACFIEHWLERAYRRGADPADACTQSRLLQAFDGSDGNLVELMVALAKTDKFRFRLKSELAP